MGSGTTELSTPVEGWRMALLLLGFATVTFILEKTIHLLEHAVKSKRGLSIALEHIKNELICLGSVSLLLSAFQNLLAQICIPLSHVTAYTDRRRRLLAGGDTDYCGPSKQSLWPISLQHDTHIFIFVVACTHIVYGTFTVYLTIWRVKSWRGWELEAQAQGRSGDLMVRKMPAKFLYKNVGSNPVIHFFLMLLRQYQMSVNQSLYSNARLLFIEKMGLPFDYNFHEVVIKGLETELMTTLHPEWHLWLIAVVWYAIPPPAYVSFWMYGLSALIIVLVGGKLVDILVQLSVQVAIKYGDSVVFGRMDSNPRAHGDVHSLGRSSMRAPAVVSPAIQQRFLDRFGGWLGPWAGSGASNAAAAPASPPPQAGMLSPMASLGIQLPRMPSRDHVVHMLRTMASEISGSWRGSGGCGSFAAAAAAAVQQEEQERQHHQHQQRRRLEAQPSAARLPAPEAQPEVPADDAAAAVPPPGLGLARGSAPATVRRHNPLRTHFADVTTAGGVGGGTAAAATALINGLAAPPAVGGERRNLSVIVESRAGSQMGERRRVQQRLCQSQKHRHSHAHPHADAHSRGLGGDSGSGSASPRRPQTLRTSQQLTHGSEGRQSGGGATPRGSAAVAKGRSAFETAQSNPDQRPSMLTLRRVFEAFRVSQDEDATSSPKQQRRRSRLGSRRPSHDRAVNGDGGGGADAMVTLDGSAGGGGLDGSTKGSAEIAAASPSRAITGGTHGSGGPREAATSEAAAEAGWASEDDDGGGSRRSVGGLLSPRRTASGRRKVPLVMRPFYCGAKYVHGSNKYVKELLTRRKARGVHMLDAKEFFWFRRPRFMTALFTLAYFQNSLSIAICIFTLAGLQDSEGLWEGVPTWAIILQLCMDMLLVPQVSLAILPFYALIQPLGSHCPQDLLEMAHQDRRPAMTGHKKRGGTAGRVLNDLSNHFRGASRSGANDSSAGPKRGEKGILAGLSALLPGAARRNKLRQEAAAAAAERAAQQQELQQSPAAAAGAGSSMLRVGSQAAAAAAGFRGSGSAKAQSYAAPGLVARRGSGVPKQDSARVARSSSAMPGVRHRLSDMSAAGSSPVARTSAALRLDRASPSSPPPQLPPAAQRPPARVPAATASHGAAEGGAPTPDGSLPASAATQPQDQAQDLTRPEAPSEPAPEHVAVLVDSRP